MSTALKTINVTYSARYSRNNTQCSPSYYDTGLNMIAEAVGIVPNTDNRELHNTVSPGVTSDYIHLFEKTLFDNIAGSEEDICNNYRQDNNTIFISPNKLTYEHNTMKLRCDKETDDITKN